MGRVTHKLALRDMGEGEAWVDQARQDGMAAPAPPDWIHANAFPRGMTNSSAKAPAPSAQAATASPPTRMDTVIALSVDIGRNHRAVEKALSELLQVTLRATDAMRLKGGKPLIAMAEVLTYYAPQAQAILTRLLASEPSSPQR